MDWFDRVKGQLTWKVGLATSTLQFCLFFTELAHYPHHFHVVILFTRTISMLSFSLSMLLEHFYLSMAAQIHTCSSHLLDSCTSYRGHFPYYFNNFFTWPTWISLKLLVLMVIWIHEMFQLDSLYGFLISTNYNITAFLLLCAIC